jgi:2-methylaconitate cis-trans-isomerase PrpF
MGIERDEVDVAGNCGNMSSAIGPYAYNARLLTRKMYEKADGDVTVRIRNTNTGKIIDSTFTVVRRQAAVIGNYTVDGVASKGSRIKLDFQQPYGSRTGKVLPTGRKVDIINGYKVTCVDGANPAVFVRASDIGVDGTILPNDFNKLPEKLKLLEEIRTSAAVAMGIAKTKAKVARTIPKIGVVSMSSTHQVLSGTTLKTSQLDLVVRFISDTQPHRAIPLTAALTTAIAARIPGTIVEQLLAPDPVIEDAITIGHASGRLQVNATMDPKNPLIPVSATVYRTAKRLFEGQMYWVPVMEPVEERMGISRKKPSLGMAFLEHYRKQGREVLTETMAREKELTRAQEHVAPSLDETQTAERTDDQPPHASLEATVDPAPRSSLEPWDYTHEGESPTNFEPESKPAFEAPEVTPEDRAHHLYRGTVTRQASRLEPSFDDETTWGETPFSGHLDVRETSESKIDAFTPSQKSQVGGKTSNVHTRSNVTPAVAPRHGLFSSPPSNPRIEKQNLNNEITATKLHIEDLQKHLNTLKIKRRIHNSLSLPTGAVPEASSHWSNSAKQVAWTTKGLWGMAKKGNQEERELIEEYKKKMNDKMKLKKDGSLSKSSRKRRRDLVENDTAGKGW